MPRVDEDALEGGYQCGEEKEEARPRDTKSGGEFGMGGRCIAGGDAGEPSQAWLRAPLRG